MDLDHSKKGRTEKTVIILLFMLIIILLIFFIGLRYIEKKSYNISAFNIESYVSECTSDLNTELDNTTYLEKININTATLQELIKLNNIGESRANAIILYRKEYGNFNTINDICKVKGIGQEIFNSIKDEITVN